MKPIAVNLSFEVNNSIEFSISFYYSGFYLVDPTPPLTLLKIYLLSLLNFITGRVFFGGGGD